MSDLVKVCNVSTVLSFHCFFVFSCPNNLLSHYLVGPLVSDKTKKTKIEGWIEPATRGKHIRVFLQVAEAVIVRLSDKIINTFMISEGENRWILALTLTWGLAVVFLVLILWPDGRSLWTAIVLFCIPTCNAKHKTQTFNSITLKYFLFLLLAHSLLVPETSVSLTLSLLHFFHASGCYYSTVAGLMFTWLQRNRLREEQHY